MRNVIHLTNGDVERVSGVIRWLEGCYTFQGFALSQSKLLCVVKEVSDDDDDDDDQDDDDA